MKTINTKTINSVLFKQEYRSSPVFFFFLLCVEFLISFCLYSAVITTFFFSSATKFTLDSSIQSSDHVSPSVCPHTSPRCQSACWRPDTLRTWWASGTWASAGPAASPQDVAFRLSWARSLAAATTLPIRAVTARKLVGLTCTTETNLPG